MSLFSIAQDFHLSHYDANPLYLNPALTGMRMNEGWDYRINANYREQNSNNLSSPFSTAAIAFDVPVNEKFSIGEFVINNKSANGYLNTFSAMLSGSYNITHKNKDSHHKLSVGLQAGVLQKSYNPQNFVYDSQYSPAAADGFDENLPTGENFRKESFFRFDVNMGIYYRFMDENKKYSPFAGFSIYHLTQSNESFTSERSNTPMRFTLHGGCYFKINDEFRILPQILYMSQAKANELNIGIQAFYKIQDTENEPMLGLAWRNKDALIFHLGLKRKNYIFRLSYDVNTSYLKKYDKTGMELSIVYTIKKKSKSASGNSPMPAEKGAEIKK